MTESVFCPQGTQDPTPRQAIARERKYPQPGEVWTDADGNYELILASGRGHCSCVWLSRNENAPCTVTLASGLVLHTNPEMISYMMLARYGEKVCTLDNDTFKPILMAAQAMLGVEAGNMEVMRQEINELRDERDKFRKSCADLLLKKNRAEQAAGDAERMKRHIAALKQEISAYKRTCRILANELRYTKSVDEEANDTDEDR